MKLSSEINFPQTRYLGSKRKLLGPLFDVFSSLDFQTALDPFSGTGVVAYLLKTMGASVTAGDVMGFNVTAARALIVNQEEQVTGELDRLFDAVRESSVSSGFIEQTFDGLFFLREENRFLDRYLEALKKVKGYKKDLALYCLGQAALAKRPYNLFHRANLNMRSRDVKRSFGNKTTWDTPFEVHIVKYARHADQAVFQSPRPCYAIKSDVLDIEPGGYDLVYMDPPYVSQKGSRVDYIDYYHFLEGLTEPEGWAERILHRYKHKPIVGRNTSPWSDPSRISDVFRQAIERFSSSQIVISYRSDGIPSIEALSSMLARVGKKVEVVDVGKYTYALSRNRKSKEIILVGR